MEQRQQLLGLKNIKDMRKQKWTYEENTSALADTGDYETIVLFKSNEDILQTSGDDLEIEDLENFTRILNLIPDLWSHKCDATEFENSLLRKEISSLKEELKTLKNNIK